MPSHSYDISNCTSLLKSEVTKLTIVAIVLFILFVAVIVLSILQIKNNVSKKLPYVQIAVALIIFCFLSVSLETQIFSYSKDLSQDSYVRYEGAALIQARKQLIFGGLPTGYTEYAISFERNGEHIELYTRKEPDLVGDVNEIFIVYAKHSKCVIDFEVIH